MGWCSEAAGYFDRLVGSGIPFANTSFAFISNLLAYSTLVTTIPHSGI